MIHKKPHRIACIFFLMSISLFLSASTATITDSQVPIPVEKKLAPQKKILKAPITAQKPVAPKPIVSPKIDVQAPITAQKPAEPQKPETPTTQATTTTAAQTATTNSWAKNNAFNDRLAYEHFLGVSADAADNLWVWTMSDDGQMYVSVGKNLNALNKTVQKVWYNVDAGISKQPTTLTNFSAGGVTKWTITHNAIWATKGIGPRPQITIEGTLWAIFAPDPKNKPLLKLLYKSVNGKDGINWKQEETLTKLQKYPNIVSATNDGSVFVLCDDGVYKRYADESWKPLIQEKGQAATSKTTQPSPKATAGKPTQKTTTTTQQKLKQVVAANKDLVYALSEKNQVLIWLNETWEPLEKASPKNDIKQIAVSPTGVLYCCANDGKVYFFAEKELAWSPCGTESVWNVQQVTASSNKIFTWTAELYKNALMKNQSGLTASDQGVIGIVASLGSGSILSPIGPLVGGVIALTASVLSRPSNHEIYEWMGEMPTPPEPRVTVQTTAKPETGKTPPATTSSSTTKAKKTAAKVAPISPEKITDDVTAKLLKELAAMNKQTEPPATPVIAKPKAVVTKPAVTPAAVKPATVSFKPAAPAVAKPVVVTPVVATPVVTQSPATATTEPAVTPTEAATESQATPEAAATPIEEATEPQAIPEAVAPALTTPTVVPAAAPTEDITPTEAAQTPDIAPTEEATPIEEKEEEAKTTEAAPEDTNQEFDPLALLNK